MTFGQLTPVRKSSKIFWLFTHLFVTLHSIMAQMAVTYDSVMSELEAREFKPVYYLMGDESYYIDKISDWIAQNVLQPEE